MIGKVGFLNARDDGEDEMAAAAAPDMILR